MAVKEFKFNLDIEKEDYIPRFKVKQYDTAIFYVNLLKNGTPFPITNETIKIFAKKSDGKLIYQEDEISIENGLIKINVKNQAFTSPGLAYAELELKSNTGQVTTATFIYEVREKVGSDKAVESVTDISTLEKIDKYVEEAKKELDKFKNDLSKLEDLVANKDKLEGQNTEAKVNIKELEKVLEDANNIVSDEGKKVIGNNIISDGITNGYVQDIKLTGKTLVNLCETPDQEFTLSPGGYYNNIRLVNLDRIHLNKDYTFICEIEIIENTTSGQLGTNIGAQFGVANYGQIIQSHPDMITNGIISSTISSSRLKKYNTVLINITDAKGYSELHIRPVMVPERPIPEGQKIQYKVKNIMILEGDYTQNPPGYFECMKSVGEKTDEIVVSSVDANLLDIDLNYVNAYVGGPIGSIRYNTLDKNTVSFVVKCKPNVKYVCGYESGGDRTIVASFSSYPKHQDLANKVEQNGIITTSIGDNYLVFYCCSSTTIPPIKPYINIDSKKEYVEHKTDKKQLLFQDVDGTWKKPILHGIWEGDKAICVNGVEKQSNSSYKFIDRLDKVAFKGGIDENWIVSSESGNETIAFKISLPNSKPSTVNNSNFICNKFKFNFGLYGNDMEGATIYSEKQLAVRVKRTNLSSNDVPGFKALLKQWSDTGAPLELVFQRKEFKEYECLDISVRSFRDETMLSVNSGPIDPGVEYYLPTGFISSDNSLSSKLGNIDSELIKLMFDYLAHNHDSRYPLKHVGDVTDFNNCLIEGVHSVGSSSDLPNAPYVDPGMGIYGTLEVLKKKNEYIQRFTSNICKMFVRFRNYAGVWSPWNKSLSSKDYSKGDIEDEKHYTIYPDGTCIQWGKTFLTFDGSHVDKSGYIYYLVPFKAGDYHVCTGNVASNNWAGYSDLVCSVAADNQSRGFVTMRRIDGQIPGGDRTVQINWIAIGRV